MLSAKEGSLTQKIFRGGIWLSLGQASMNILGLVKLAFLGRILTPTDFGLMGIALVSLRWLEVFTESGFSAALIHKKGDVLDYINTAWVVQLVRGAIVAIILFIGSNVIAEWAFNTPNASIILKSVAPIIFLRGLQNPALILLKKKLDLRAEFYWKLSGAICGALTGIVLGFLLRNIWALVGSVVVSQLAITITSYVVFPFKPKLIFSLKKAKELYGYGRSIFLSNLFTFFSEYSDSIIVAKFCGIVPLGYYQMARQFSYDPSAQAGRLIQGVMFPAFSSLADPEKTRNAFLKTLTWVTALVFPLGILVSSNAEGLILFIMGNKWAATAPTFTILIWASVLVILNGITYSCLAGIGKPHFIAFANAFNLIGLSLFFVPQIKLLNELGMALVFCVSILLSTSIQLILLSKSLKISVTQLIASLNLTAIASIPFVFLLLISKNFPEHFFYILLLPSLICYATILLFFLKKYLKTAKEIA
jgi:O-antigen/teichoic acid export membrane protein